METREKNTIECNRRLKEVIHFKNQYTCSIYLANIQYDIHVENRFRNTCNLLLSFDKFTTFSIITIDCNLKVPSQPCDCLQGSCTCTCRFNISTGRHTI